jgi:hypothetical protein
MRIELTEHEARLVLHHLGLQNPASRLRLSSIATFVAQVCDAHGKEFVQTSDVVTTLNQLALSASHIPLSVSCL